MTRFNFALREPLFTKTLLEKTESVDNLGFQFFNEYISYRPFQYLAFKDIRNRITEENRAVRMDESEEDVDSKIYEFYDESNIVKVERTWGSYDYPTFPILGGYWANGHSVGKIVSSSPINDLQPTGNLGNSDSYNYKEVLIYI